MAVIKVVLASLLSLYKVLAELVRVTLVLRGIISWGNVLLQNLAQASLGGKRAAQWIAEQTNGYSGADLHELATEAARHSVQSMSSALSGLR